MHLHSDCFATSMDFMPSSFRYVIVGQEIGIQISIAVEIIGSFIDLVSANFINYFVIHFQFYSS